MRTNRRLVSAALTALMFVIPQACGDEITMYQYQRFPIVTGGGTTPGGCQVTITVSSVTAGGISVGGVMNLMPQDRRVVVARATGTCVGDQRFRFTSSNEAVATITALTDSTAEIVALTPGQTTMTVLHLQTNINTSFLVNVGTNNPPATPTVSTNPTSLALNNGFNCPASGTFVVNTTNVSNPSIVNLASSNSSVATATASGMTVTVTRGTATGSANITGAINGYPNLTFSVSVSVGTADCGTPPPPPPSIGVTWSQPSVCLSTITGSSVRDTVSVTVTGVTNPTLVLVSSNNTFVGVLAPVTVTGNTATWVVQRASSISANGNLQLFINGANTPASAIPWNVTSSACPGTGSSIVYSPPSSTGAVGTTLTLNVTTCIINGVNCTTRPFWDSSDPSRVGVRGTETEQYGTPPVTFYVGMQATLTRVYPGSAQICVQPGVTITTPRYCGSGGNSHIVQ